MRNTLSDLNNALFEQIERLQDDGLSDSELEREIRRAGAVRSIAEAIVKNGELSLKAVQHITEYGDPNEIPHSLPAMLKG